MMNQSSINDFVAALLECSKVRQRDGRNAIVNQLSLDIRSRLERSDIAQIDVVSIVSNCRDWQGGLDELVKAVRLIEGDDIPFQKVLKIYEQLKSGSPAIVPIKPSQQDERDFTSLIRNLCQQIGWKIAEIDAEHALLRFQMSSGNAQNVLIVPYDLTLEFSVPSAFVFNSTDEIPHELSTLLLMRNAQTGLTFWTIEETEEQCFYSCMQNAEIELLDVLYFKKIIEALVGECDALEQLWKENAEKQQTGGKEQAPHWSDFRF